MAADMDRAGPGRPEGSAPGNAVAAPAVDSSGAPAGLAALEARLAHDFSCLGLPPKPWMPQRLHQGRPVLDVAIVGAGQAGMAAALGLMHLGIQPLLIDRAAPGFEGPWATTARMETLRSPKELVGPAMGFAALSFRAWFEAQWGAAAWAALDKIPRLQWMDYLRWYQRVLKLPVRHHTEVRAVLPQADGLVRLELASLACGEAGARTGNMAGAEAATETLWARRVVLATGRDGLGGPWVPEMVARLPRQLWAHSAELPPDTAWAGKRVAVIGGGSSAMDAAATALEAGAASVDLLVRRAVLPRINKSKGAGAPGLVHGHFDLPDAHKWRLRHYINSTQVPPPHGSTLRVSRHANARFHLGCPVLDVQADGGRLRVRTPKGDFGFDLLVASTGFVIDLGRRPEFAAMAPHIRRWADRPGPRPGPADAELEASPELGPAFEFRERTPGACPGLERVHCFCYPATLSHGALSGDIPNISDGAKRLAQGIASLFYREDFEHHFARLQAYDDPELLGDEWTETEGLPAEVAWAAGTRPTVAAARSAAASASAAGTATPSGAMSGGTSAVASAATSATASATAPAPARSEPSPIR